MFQPFLMYCYHHTRTLNFSFIIIIIISVVLINICTCSTDEWQSSPCPHSDMCKSQWDFCGYGALYCGDGCKAGPCLMKTTPMIITPKIFQCIFNTLDERTRIQRLNNLRRSGWRPMNRDEAAIFLAHVYHETDGLKTLSEYCAPNCHSNYNESWCDVRAIPGKSYHGRGWFQISYPCNYHAAGKALGFDLLRNPDLVSQRPDLAVRTAVWFYTTNQMAEPARRGDFAATTRIINGKQECEGGPGVKKQQTRVETYRRVRKCFDLGISNRSFTC